MNDNGKTIIQRYNLETGLFEQENILNSPISYMKNSEKINALYLGFQDGKTGKLYYKDLIVEELPEQLSDIYLVEIHEDVSEMIMVTNKIFIYDYNAMEKKQEIVPSPLPSHITGIYYDYKNEQIWYYYDNELHKYQFNLSSGTTLIADFGAPITKLLVDKD